MPKKKNIHAQILGRRGGKVVTEKKRAQLRAALAKRWQKYRENKALDSASHADSNAQHAHTN
jgi:hypothetical protein